MIKITTTLPETSKQIRTEVFTDEQGFAEVIDDIDLIATHLVMYKEEEAIATCRLYKDEDGVFWIGRIAVKKALRGQNIGKLIVEEAEKEIKRLGGKRVDISSQLRVQGFYEKLGYMTIGDTYIIQDCPHVHMQKNLI